MNFAAVVLQANPCSTWRGAHTQDRQLRISGVTTSQIHSSSPCQAAKSHTQDGRLCKFRNAASVFVAKGSSQPLLCLADRRLLDRFETLRLISYTIVTQSLVLPETLRSGIVWEAWPSGKAPRTCAFV